MRLVLRLQPWQPDAAGRLTPERPGFDDLIELPVVRAVVPPELIFSTEHPQLVQPTAV